jgi:hypothetical protein
MAIVQNPITGRSKNKFGTAIFSTQFGQNVMRTKPLEVKNPKTPAQLAQRAKFTTVVELMRQVLTTINEAYDDKIRNMSPFNRVVGLNLKESFDPVTGEFDYKKAIFCDYEGSNVSDVVLTFQVGQIIDITWDPATTDTDELNAPLKFLVVNSTKNKVKYIDPGVLRSAGAASITVPARWYDDVVSVQVMAEDYTSENPQPNDPKPLRYVIEYKAGGDLSDKVK